MKDAHGGAFAAHVATGSGFLASCAWRIKPGRWRQAYLVALVTLSTFLSARPLAAEVRLVPMRPIDRPYPALDWCQIQDWLSFDAPRCTTFVDFAVKLTRPAGGTFGVVGIDDVLVMRSSDMLSSPVCTRCPNVTDANGLPIYHTWCYSCDGTPILDEDFGGDWFANGWRMGPGASVASVAGSRALRFAASSGVPAAPCDTARARLILTGLQPGQQYTVTAWWSVESPQPGTPLFYWGVSKPSACAASSEGMPTEVSAPAPAQSPTSNNGWPDLPTACQSCSIQVTNSYTGSILMWVGPDSYSMSPGETRRFPVSGPTPLCVYNCIWGGNDWTCSSPCLQETCPGATYAIQRDGLPEGLTIVRTGAPPALAGTCWATPYQCGAQVNAERPERLDDRVVLRARGNPLRSGGVALDYSLAAPGRVRLSILDVAGAVVATLVEGEHLAGTHTARWDGRRASGSRATAAIYYAVLQAGGERRTVSLVMLE